ncbi:hypothetical protein ASG07_06740 [Sphingomonas sp. Leaf343]|nr:hypothetical protein ASG07_06740 [Sphingomonas sp. Leaf343]
MRRHYGMDWLRIGAFAILILYHIGMVFVPWNFHAKSHHVERWATVPMLAVNAWRLTLLFVVSGYASRALLARSHGLGRFVRDRSWRLLVPLALGVAVVVPPQAWVELVLRYGYPAGYLHFWGHDYFTFRRLGQVTVPTWNHLWFVGYLWLYTALLAIGVAAIRIRRAQHGFDWLFGSALGGVGVIVVPLAWSTAIHARWFQMVGETHALVGDWIAHLSYFPAFLFGFALARSPATMRAIGRWWPAGAVLAIAGYAYVVGIERGWIGPWGPALFARYGVAHAAQQWGAIVALIGIAERWFNRDAPIRATLTEAVFPFYLVHQTIIVVVAYVLWNAALTAGQEFAVLVAATVAGCTAFYYGGRAVPWLRPLIGLRRQS